MKHKNLLIRCIIVYCMFIQTVNIIAQTTYDEDTEYLGDLIPKAPDVASLERYGNYDVELYSGMPNISIPIYTIKENNINIPIALRYVSNGIKVNEEASWVGLGWSLNAGGVIIQNVKDKDDFNSITGIYSNSAWTNYSLLNEGLIFNNYFFHHIGLFGNNEIGALGEIPHDSPTDKWAELENYDWAQRQGDTEPDIFHLVLPTISVKFYFDYTMNKFVCVDNNQLNIDYNNNTWVITSPSGIVYRFNSYTTRSTKNAFNIVGRTFYLDEIESLKGGTVSFEYTEPYLLSTIPSITEYYIHNGPISGGSPLVKDNPLLKGNFQIADGDVKTKYLKKISFSNGQIDFVMSNDRQDLIGYQLNEVKVSSMGKVSLTEFSFGYFDSESEIGYISKHNINPSNFFFNSEQLQKRLKLDSLNINGKVFRFYYDESTKLPQKDTYSRDYWNYYNGKNNTTLIPDLNLFPGIDIQGQNKMLFVESGNRQPDEFYCKSGVLSRIQFPTGGSTYFEWELNSYQKSYRDPLIEVNKLFSKIDFNTIWYYPLNNDSSSFAIETDAIARLEIKMSKIGSELAANQVPKLVLYKKVNTTYEEYTSWDYPNYKSGEFIDEEIIDLPIGDYYLKYVFEQEPVSILVSPEGYGEEFSGSCSINTVPKFPENQLDVRCDGAGLRIKRIVNDDLIQKFTKEFQYDTYDDNKIYSHGLLLNTPNFFSKNSYFYKDGLNFQLYRINSYKISSDSRSSLISLFNTDNIGYSKVKEIWFGNSKDANGGVEYIYHNEPRTDFDYAQENGFVKGSDFASPYPIDNQIKYAYDSPPGIPHNSMCMNGRLKRKITKGKSNNPVIKEEFFYDNRLMRNVLSFRMLGRDLGCYLISPNKVDGIPWDKDWAFDLYKYKLPVYQIESTGIKTTQYFDADSVVEFVNFLYYDNGFLRSKVQTDSQGKRDSLLYEYVYQKNQEPYMAMKELNILNWPISTKSYKGVNLINHKQFDYSVFSNKYQLSKINEFNNLINQLETTLRINKYDNKGNILEYLPTEQDTISLYYSNNLRHPIIKAENIRYDVLNSFVNQVIQDYFSPHTIYTLVYSAGDQTNVSQKTLWSDFNFRIRQVFMNTNVQITTYTYNPLIGMTSQTDPNGITTYYEYDDFGRLEFVKDHQGNILKKYDYNYKTN